MRLSHIWLALRQGLWLCGLPLLLRWQSLPVLLQQLTAERRKAATGSKYERDQAVRLVVRLCQCRLFCLPWFPRPCLRQALVLYRVLHQMGEPAVLYVGVRKDGGQLHAHSWVTLQGQPVADPTPPEAFTPLYSYPSSLDNVVERQ